MKKILILLLIPTLCFGQIRIESHKQELFKGVKLNYKVYYSPIPTKDWILFLHGSGEGGPADGSQLDKIEANGLTKYARAGATYNFNILAPQALKLPGDAISRYETIRAVIVDLVKEQYGAGRLIVTGLSQGGMEAVDWGFRDKKGYIDGIIVMCGKTSWSPDIPRDTVISLGKKTAVLGWSKYRDVPWCGVHGTLDKAPNGVNFSDGQYVYKSISFHKSRTIFIPIIGGGHSSAWVKGYDQNDPVGKQVFTFIGEIFTKLPPPIRCEAILDTTANTATFILPGLEIKTSIIRDH